MIGLMFFGVVGLIIDYLLRKLINDKKLLSFIHIVIIFGFSIVLLIELQLNA